MNSLRRAARGYLAMRRALGFKLHDSGKLLLRFVAFMEQQQAYHITTSLALTWAIQHPHAHSRAWAAQRLSAVRGFARHRSASDPRTQITPALISTPQSYRARPSPGSKPDTASRRTTQCDTPGRRPPQPRPRPPAGRYRATGRSGLTSSFV